MPNVEGGSKLNGTLRSIEGHLRALAEFFDSFITGFLRIGAEALRVGFLRIGI